MASQVLLKHFRVKLSDVTTAGPLSATRYFAWYFTTGSLYAYSDAPVCSRAFQSFLIFLLPPFAREVTSTVTATPRAVALSRAAKIARSLHRNNDKVISRRALSITSTIVLRRSLGAVTTRSTGSPPVVRCPSYALPPGVV